MSAAVRLLTEGPTMTGSHTSRRTFAHKGLPLLAAASLIVAVSTGAASADTSRGPATVPVAQGSGTAPLDAGTPVGATADSTPVQISIVLRSPRLGELQRRVENGWGGRYLTANRFAQTYGASPFVVAGIQHYLASFGITSSVFADQLDISATGTAAQINKAFGVALTNYRVTTEAASPRGSRHSRIVYGTLHNPRVPSQWGPAIIAVLGLSNYAPYVSRAETPAHAQAQTATVAPTFRQAWGWPRATS